jgi:hypothetical protein
VIRIWRTRNRLFRQQQELVVDCKWCCVVCTLKSLVFSIYRKCSNLVKCTSPVCYYIVTFSYSNFIDDDHVDGVRLCLWTAATSGPIVHHLGDIWAWRTVVEWYRRRNAWFRPPEICGSPSSSHLAANKEELCEGSEEFDLAKYLLCSYFEVIFIFLKMLRHGADGFTSPPKEGALRIFIAKIHWHRPGLNPRTLGLLASTLTTTPPRKLPILLI